MQTTTATAEPTPQPEILSVRALRRRFAGLEALDRLDLSVRPGELLAIIGPNGAGKSTLFNVVTGLLPPTAGTVEFDGRDVTGLPPHRIARLGIGRKFQVPNVFEGLPVRQNLVVASRGRDGLRGLVGHDRADPERIEEVLRRLRLDEKADLPASELSHGERQWLEIGAVLVSDPRLLLLDEPTAGMTMRETRMTEDLLRTLSEGHTIVVIEHNIRFVREVARRVVVMHRGRVLADGPISQIERDERVRDVYLGRSA
jgi:urea ABC transporter ATP-binding protein UrtD